MTVHVRAVGTALPGPPLSNARLAAHFGTNEAWVQWADTFIGTRTRHLSVDLDTGTVRTDLAGLAATAGGRALSAANVAPAEVDVMVLATSTPDALVPATVTMAAERLGINDVPAYQLQSGCSGAIQALELARRLLEGGAHRTALVLGGDMCAKHVDLAMDITELPPAETVSTLLFGDGVGAAVLSTADDGEAPELVEAFVRLTGLGRDPAQVVEWFGAAGNRDGSAPITEDYKAIEANVPAMSAEILAELLDRAGWEESDVDYLLPPQLSGRMTERIVEHLGLHGAEEISCVTETANVGNATPFFQLERLLPRIAAGERALGVAVESSKWIKSGFAVARA
ncbi:3-oxoacyl-ACP synthase III family protein [Amycolatopsis sp. NPDC004079]|uniref:3-oxoacyl-ACP synthase III family protein n=1 Tax=Amycolatopsis sp. NPDC004079 TaxID=3154549 RepID=UPI0033B8305B